MMLERATKLSWMTLDPPKLRESLGYEQILSNADASILQWGMIPEEMEDKWFAYFDEGWLYMHRSWTGALIYWLKLDRYSGGVRVVESYVNRDPEQYSETDIVYDRMLLDFLLRQMLLGHSVPFPIRTNNIVKEMPGIYQHYMVGRNYPEQTVRDQ